MIAASMSLVLMPKHFFSGDHICHYSYHWPPRPKIWMKRIRREWLFNIKGLVISILFDYEFYLWSRKLQRKRAHKKRSESLGFYFSVYFSFFAERRSFFPTQTIHFWLPTAHPLTWKFVLPISFFFRLQTQFTFCPGENLYHRIESQLQIGNWITEKSVCIWVYTIFFRVCCVCAAWCLLLI